MKLIRFLSVLILLLLTASVALATGIQVPSISFSWETGSQVLTVDVIRLTDQSYGLFLPGACDPSSLTVSLSCAEPLLWGSREISDGDTIDLTADIGTTVTVSGLNGRKIVNIAVMRGSSIPSLFLTVDAREFKRINIDRYADISRDGSLLMLNADGTVGADERMTSFHLRGNSTRFGLKKPYQLRLEHKTSLGGMPEGKTWILLANWFDVSLVRNQITLDLCRELGLNGTPRGIQTDLYVNGEYLGVYYLCEKIQLKSSRLDITNMEAELQQLNDQPLSRYKWKISRDYSSAILRWHDIPNEPEDITGGFLLEIEKALQFSTDEASGGFMTDYRLCVIIKEPSQVGLKAANYIAGLVNDFHTAAMASDGISPATGKHYSEYIDMDSFACKVIVEELSGNYDVTAGSQFMYKDSDLVDSRLHAGPGWDYDLTYGNKAQKSLRNPLTLNYVYNRSSAASSLYRCLLKQPDFCARTRQIFMRQGMTAIKILLGEIPAPEDSCLRSIDEYTSAISDSAQMNFVRWPTRRIGDVSRESSSSFETAVAFLKNWITQRSQAMS